LHVFLISRDEYVACTPQAKEEVEEGGEDGLLALSSLASSSSSSSFPATILVKAGGTPLSMSSSATSRSSPGIYGGRVEGRGRVG
jgi:hypothetical protein